MKRTALKQDAEKVRAWQERSNATAAQNAREKPRKAMRRSVPVDAPRDKNGRRCVEQACVVCGEAYLARLDQASWRKTCSTKCSGLLKRQRGGASRAGEANPNFRGGQRAGVRNRDGERRWYAARADRCEHPECPGTHQLLAVHHCVYAQHVRRAGGDRFDPRNAYTLCESCHTSHHRRGRVVPLSALPDSVYEFAAELFGPAAAYEYLRRRYAGGDPRLAALLAEEGA